MELTYHILGPDGQTYGPCNLVQLQAWVDEGRVAPATQTCRSDQQVWKTATEFDELIWNRPKAPPALANTTGSPLQTSPVATEEQQQLERSRKSGADWFFWIAGLSLINVISTMSGGGWGFALSLGIMDVIAVFGRELGTAGFAVGVVLNFFVLGLFVLHHRTDAVCAGCGAVRAVPDVADAGDPCLGRLRPLQRPQRRAKTSGDESASVVSQGLRCREA
jgi:hypothetical protein